MLASIKKIAASSIILIASTAQAETLTFKMTGVVSNAYDSGTTKVFNAPENNTKALIGMHVTVIVRVNDELAKPYSTLTESRKHYKNTEVGFLSAYLTIDEINQTLALQKIDKSEGFSYISDSAVVKNVDPDAVTISQRDSTSFWKINKYTSSAASLDQLTRQITLNISSWENHRNTADLSEYINADVTTSATASSLHIDKTLNGVREQGAILYFSINHIESLVGCNDDLSVIN